jgi:FixJ family two-component response regulator
MKERSPVVFIVDDDEAVRSSLRLLLKSVGLVPSALGSAREFLEKYDPAQPGCLVLDVRMPEMSGLELQEKLNLQGAVIPLSGPVISPHSQCQFCISGISRPYWLIYRRCSTSLSLSCCLR